MLSIAAWASFIVRCSIITVLEVLMNVGVMILGTC